MSIWIKAGPLLLVATATVTAANPYPGIGRPATPKEVAAWDIDVRPDFQGLPRGRGSVAQGQTLWEAQCASCHGVFGESNEVFNPIVGGTGPDDVKTGRVAKLRDIGFPQRTTLMKLSTVSTLWDYIHRAMPWNAPKSLQPDEVYALTAFVLNLGGVVPDDFTLSDENIAAVQARLPNRNGMTRAHGLWPGVGQPDVRASACVSNCGPEPRIASSLPDFARNQHGNLALQNRLVGAQLGVDTTQPPRSSLPAAGAAAVVQPVALATPAKATTPSQLLNQHSCVACHHATSRRVGPSWQEVAGKHGARADAQAYLVQKIRSGGQGVWGAIPMPPQNLPEADAQAIARWLAAGAR